MTKDQAMQHCAKRASEALDDPEINRAWQNCYYYIDQRGLDDVERGLNGALQAEGTNISSLDPQTRVAQQFLEDLYNETLIKQYLARELHGQIFNKIEDTSPYDSPIRFALLLNFRGKLANVAYGKEDLAQCAHEACLDVQRQLAALDLEFSGWIERAIKAQE
jgi:hypothetical protein